jgi:uncharacterized protein (TIRG00374 family)
MDNKLNQKTKESHENVDTIIAAADKSSGRWIRVIHILRCFVSIGLLWFLLRKIEFIKLLEIMKQSLNQWPMLVIACLTPVLGLVIAALRWKILLAAQNFCLSLMVLLKAVLIGAFFNQLLPSTIGGDVARSYWISKLLRPTTSSPKANSILNMLTIVALDRFIGLIGICAICIFVFLARHTLIYRFPGVWLGIITITISMLVASVLVYILLRLMTGNPSFNNRPLSLVKEKTQSILSIIEKFRDTKPTLIFALMLSITLQGLIIIQYYLLSVAFNVNISLWDLSFLIPMVTLISLLPVTINGIGLRENALAALGVMFGINPGEAILLAWSFLAISMSYALFGGALQFRYSKNF